MADGKALGCLIRFGIFEADLQTGELRKQGLRIKVRDQSFQILALLLERSGQMVTREELQKKLWAADTFVDFDRGLNKAVNQLREALGDSADSPRIIETLPKRGYRFIASVETLRAGDIPAAPSASTSLPAREASARPHARWWWIVGAAFLLAGGGAAWFFYVRKAPAIAERNLVVLTEFDNHTGDPAFDYSLKQALQIDLEQSPFLKVLSDQQVVDTLRLMGRAPDQPLTQPMAREVCLRAGGKAVLGGSIARLGNEFVLGLSAVNCQTGESLAQEQKRSSAREAVLRELDKAVSDLRGKLGESLSSIRRFDRPLHDFVSTSSLEAFQAYANGQKTVQHKGRPYGIPFFRRAAELDPEFAVAYMQLGLLYGTMGEARLSAENTLKAYGLRERVSEFEKFMITAQYYQMVTLELEKVPPVCQVWSQSYPQDGVAQERASWAYMELGRHENALSEAEEAYRKRGEVPVAINILARNYIFLNRFQEAKRLLAKAFVSNTGQLFWRQGMYLLGFFDADTKRMDEQVAWAMNTPGAEDTLLSMHAETNAYFGRLQKARELSRLAIEFAQRNEFKERAALLIAAASLREAWLGNSEAAREQARAALGLVAGRDVRALAALALARVGDAAQARKLADQLDAQFPSGTLIHSYWLPAIRAQIELSGGRPLPAIDLLYAASSYELADTPSPLVPIYIRAEARLRSAQGAAAAAEFQKILQHPGISGNSVIGALAVLGLARAYMVSGETVKARSEYEDFFALWKEADIGIPILRQAKTEYVKLN